MSTPSVHYLWWVPRHGWVDPSNPAFGTDDLLRFHFYSSPHDGIAIASDGKPWNSPEHLQNITPWFEATNKLLLGEDASYVWAWEECDTWVTRLSGERIEIEDRGFLPPVVFPLVDFLLQLTSAGKAALATSELLTARLAELTEHLPDLAQRWASELPEGALVERTRSLRPLVEIQGKTVENRWHSVRQAPLHPSVVDELQPAVALLESNVQAFVAGRITLQ